MKRFLILVSVILFLSAKIGCSTRSHCYTSNDDCVENKASCFPNDGVKYKNCGTCECDWVDPLKINDVTLTPAKVGEEYTGKEGEITASGGVLPYQWSITSTSDTSWLTIDENTGVLSSISGGIPSSPGTITVTLVLKDSSVKGKDPRPDNNGVTKEVDLTIDNCPLECQMPDGVSPSTTTSGTKCVDGRLYNCTQYFTGSSGVCLHWVSGSPCMCHNNKINCCAVDNICAQQSDTQCKDNVGGNAYIYACTEDISTGCLVLDDNSIKQCDTNLCTTDLKSCGNCEINPDYCIQGSQPKCTSDPKKKQVCGYNQTTGCYLWSTIDCESTKNCVEGTCKYVVGTNGPGGGIIFYVNSDDSQYMEAADTDQGQAPWGCSDKDIPNSHNQGIGDGKSNTEAIVADCGESGIAAKLCYYQDIKGNGYTDWFLPSSSELNQLYQTKNIVGGSFRAAYWSSSSYVDIPSYARFVSFYNGSVLGDLKTTTIYVRCVRSGP